MKPLIKYIIVLFLISMGYLVEAQQGSNPFEIIRTNESESTTSSTPNSAQSVKKEGNAFEVYRGDDSITVNRPSLNTSTDTSAISSQNASVNSNNDGNEVDIDANDMNYLSDNPFEVSHIPLRRSELKEQSGSKTVIRKNGDQRSVVNTESSSNTFIFWLVLFTLLLLAIVVNVQRNALSKVVKSITNENVLKLSKREENGGLTGHYIMLYVVFFINLASFVYLIAKYYSGINGFSNWLIIAAGVTGIYLIRHISMTFLGQIFNITKDSSLYSFTIMTFNIFLGLALIPINLVVAFSPTEISKVAMYVGIGLILILLLIRLLRGLLIGVRFIGEHIFQFFLYLCTFEIAPILILLRILGDQ